MNRIGFGLIALCVLVALAHSLLARWEEKTGGKTVIRIAHWQLETGIRSAF